MGKARITPGRLPVLQARVGMVVVGLMLVFGLGFGVVVLRETPDSEGVLKILVGLFFLVWIVACLAILKVFARVARQGRDGLPDSLSDSLPDSLLEVEYDGPDFESRLRKLEGLRRDGLLSDQEYEAKRQEMLKEKW